MLIILAYKGTLNKLLQDVKDGKDWKVESAYEIIDRTTMYMLGSCQAVANSKGLSKEVKICCVGDLLALEKQSESDKVKSLQKLGITEKDLKEIYIVGHGISYFNLFAACIVGNLSPDKTVSSESIINGLNNLFEAYNIKPMNNTELVITCCHGTVLEAKIMNHSTLKNYMTVAVNSGKNEVMVALSNNATGPKSIRLIPITTENPLLQALSGFLSRYYGKDNLIRMCDEAVWKFINQKTSSNKQDLLKELMQSIAEPLSTVHQMNLENNLETIYSVGLDQVSKENSKVLLWLIDLHALIYDYSRVSVNDRSSNKHHFMDNLQKLIKMPDTFSGKKIEKYVKELYTLYNLVQINNEINTIYQAYTATSGSKNFLDFLKDALHDKLGNDKLGNNIKEQIALLIRNFNASLPSDATVTIKSGPTAIYKYLENKINEISSPLFKQLPQIICNQVNVLIENCPPKSAPPPKNPEPQTQKMHLKLEDSPVSNPYQTQ